MLFLPHCHHMESPARICIKVPHWLLKVLWCKLATETSYAHLKPFLWEWDLEGISGLASVQLSYLLSLCFHWYHCSDASSANKHAGEPLANNNQGWPKTVYPDWTWICGSLGFPRNLSGRFQSSMHQGPSWKHRPSLAFDSQELTSFLVAVVQRQNSDSGSSSGDGFHQSKPGES